MREKMRENAAANYLRVARRAVLDVKRSRATCSGQHNLCINRPQNRGEVKGFGWRLDCPEKVLRSGELPAGRSCKHKQSCQKQVHKPQSETGCELTPSDRPERASGLSMLDMGCWWDCRYMPRRGLPH